jgi:uncharacterized repeat protein (TIGR02543 family)
MLIAFSVGNVWATQQSYTIELKPSGTNSNNALTASNFVTSCVTSGGTYISSCASTAKVYTNGGFVKLGSSSAVGNFTLNLSEAGQVKATSIVVSAKQYSSNEKTLKITCSADATGVSFTDLGSSFTNKTLSLDGETAITSITVTTTTKRGYVESVTVFYDDDQGGDPIPVLQSIAVSNNPTTTTYEEGNVFDVTGLIVTGTYDVGDPAAITEGITWKARTNALSDDAVALANYHLTKGQTSLQVQATASGKTSDWYTVSGLTVNEHVVTPGTYSIPMTNALWGTSYSGTASAETEVSGSSHDVSVTLTKGGSTNMYINDTETRAYGSYSLVIGVPAGYVITAMTFTKGSNWNCSTTTGTLSGQSWTGTANSVAFSFDGRTDFKAVSVTYELDVKYAINFSAPANGTLVINDGVQNITSGDEYHAGDELTVTATPSEGYKLDGIKVIETGSDPENDVTSTVLAGTTLTVPAYAVTVSATFSANEKPFATLTLSEIGEETVYYNNNTKREDDIVSLPLTAASCSKVFVGWDPDENCATEPTYAPGADFTLGASASNKLYAVYATPIVDTESEPELAQTHLYDTWTYSGPAADKDSYRLFGNGAYVESTEFDLSTLAKVIVYGGTYGGGTYNSFTIGDGTTTWKNGTVTGTNKAGVNTVTDADCTPLSGIGKLYVTSTCGNGDGGNSGNGIRISKVEIYTYGTTYGDYSTACLAKVDAPTFPVAQQEYTSATNISISAVTGATIYYSLDGNTPAKIDANKYTAPFTLSTRGEYIVKAIAVKDGFADSDVATAHYSINLPFANLADLVAANMADGSEVIVSFADEVITNKGSKYIYLTTLDANDNPIEIYHSSTNVPEAWVVGGKVAATSKRFTWTLFNSSQWELVPVGEFAWATDLAYTAPKTVSSVVVSGEPTKKVYTVGETFDPAGLTVTVNYSDETSEVNPAVGVTFTTDPANGKMALEQTSIKVKATYNTVTSTEWFTVGDLTVNDLETKTIAEFIAAEGGRCYLVGTVSNITNTTYGNFDLTDASGTIYVYGCLDTEGASQKFATLDVVEDDYIKVIADVYEYYNNTTHEAKNVQFVAELEKPDVPVSSVSVANATVKVNKTVQLTATVLPVDATNKSVTWSVKEGSEAYAEVSATGVVTGKAEGNAVIVATSVADNTKFGECTVTVTGGINFAAGDFVLVEDAAELTEGTYVIVAGSGDNNAAMKYHAGSDNNHKAKAAIKEGKYLHYDSEFGVYEIKNYVVNTEVVGISFYNDDAENYFALPANSNQLKVSAEQNNNSSWTVAVSEGVTTLTNKAFTSRTLRYNSGSSCFASYDNGQKTISLYKYVTPAAYRVYYNDNVAEEEIEVPVYQSVDGENKVTISAVEPVRDGYLFGGWKDGEANVYEAGVEYTLSADLTLYAQWTTATVSTLSYNPNGGTLIGGETAIADADVAEGTNLTIEANVYEKGDNFVFAGWQLGDDVYQPGDPFVMPATDVEFVAKWDAVEVSDYALVTDLAQLQAGDKIIIVAAELDFAAGAQAGTYREHVAIGKTASKNNLILAGSTPTEFTLGISDGKFSFNDGTGYMYEEEVKKVKTQANPYYWTISIDGDAIATISATTDNALKYNSNSPRFTTYESGQQTLQLYRKPGAAPVYTTVRTDLNEGEYYTMCLKNKVTAVQGGTIWRVLSKAANDKDIILEEVTGNLDAGRPYIFRATADKLEVACTGVVANAPITTGNNGLIGSFIQTQITQSDDNYIIYNNALYFVNSNNVYVGANRAYLDMTGVPAYDNNEPQQGNAPRRRVVMTVHGEQVATGMDALNASDKPVKVLINGQLFILRGEKMFDAKGQLVK